MIVSTVQDGLPVAYYKPRLFPHNIARIRDRLQNQWLHQHMNMNHMIDGLLKYASWISFCGLLIILVLAFNQLIGIVMTCVLCTLSVILCINDTQLDDTAQITTHRNRISEHDWMEMMVSRYGADWTTIFDRISADVHARRNHN